MTRFKKTSLRVIAFERTKKKSVVTGVLCQQTSTARTINSNKL